ncbi:Ubiquinone/menaquinone biosynthesis C-methyltransferase UbiE [Streptococcus intermedius]|jgi:methyltransferase small domain protein|uniref:Ubiquinone/menaquinone biosynthesis C-methyltransferase UbiE n=1 Tax=Streptococcus intermedius TaxID=1338 RepID=A0AAE8G0Y1_STRIT|nr:class I SAM-dependent methyltransferase [Streptococcus intermedius]RSJ14139.1 Ubiquinone/menaquinone biosynthesis C-methyltransferase UbiE [Streptococcus intermedius]RSJ21086.1 Ubiquinone/menaquinone biosynthesis C-methyltransferase UbiE [Streptococcus intermedius]RSJ24204.1 Ubiquinone/menaquinone biosynthesis C-methyltransferase UbiE [Streptococcus intermedius]RSJ27255.1 Ubiquinone/menaquinone biosynthesis C-methyltransferase UbiE [Streptococcus intermedius]
MEHHFNHKAESFDSPKNKFLADLIRQEVKNQVVDFSDKHILDFGGGTGLVSLPLAKQSGSVTLVDISEKMLEQAHLKVEKQGIENVQLLERDLLLNPLNQLFDIIVVSRVLHHVPNVEETLAMFRNHLVEAGRLFIADFVKTDINQHGFKLDDLEEKLFQTGFLSVKSRVIYSAEELFLGNHAELFLSSAQKT